MLFSLEDSSSGKAGDRGNRGTREQGTRSDTGAGQKPGQRNASKLEWRMNVSSFARSKIDAENLESGSYIKRRSVLRNKSIWKKAARRADIGLTAI